jgi:uncharacterized protein
MAIRISSLHLYPIKSCGAIDVQSCAVDARGLKYDRNWMLIDENGTQITQRDVAAMALIKPAVSEDGRLSLSAPDMVHLVVEPPVDAPNVRAVVWDNECVGIDQGDDAARWFGSFLGRSCRLVRMSDRFRRRVDAKRLPDKVIITAFADVYPIHLISQESLDELNGKLEFSVLMNRFRPNIVVTGCTPFQEDSWKRVEINGIEMRVGKPCARCVMVTIDQEDASIGKEPLRTLAAYRKVDNKVLFGQLLAHENTGTLSVGDSLGILN